MLQQVSKVLSSRKHFLNSVYTVFFNTTTLLKLALNGTRDGIELLYLTYQRNRQHMASVTRIPAHHTYYRISKVPRDPPFVYILHDFGFQYVTNSQNGSSSLFVPMSNYSHTCVPN